MSNLIPELVEVDVNGISCMVIVLSGKGFAAYDIRFKAQERRNQDLHSIRLRDANQGHHQGRRRSYLPAGHS